MTTTVLLPIGALAEATGVTVTTLRHYDDLGIIASAPRVGGKRRFASDAVGRVNFTRRAQRFGFSLTEIADLLDDTSGKHRRILQDKLAALRAQQIELAAIITILEDASACGCEVIAKCPAAVAP